MRSNGLKPGILVTHFQSNGHKAPVSDLISFVARDKSLPYLVDKEKLRKDIQSEKENEKGRHIICMLIDITTTLGCSQNGLTAIVGTELIQRIVAEVNEAHFFGVFAEGTPAFSHEERLAVGV
ncbi:hypothetical protein QYM36_019963 [Artemia franciscana]|uniref:Uncharacterized protein n=1 Tax=Artemia franciscana TaxID=6661 RepID=A0AA88KSX0_ARTSF|nr:hypothetical protein QYM36_019963 [Artemia franciscana]